MILNHYLKNKFHLCLNNYFINVLGRKSDISGKKIKAANMASMIKIKGSTPLITSPKGSLAIELTTNRFKPTGGVIIASSIFTVMTMAKWIGSIPKFLMMGSKMGRVMRMMETASRKVPMTKNIMLTTKKNAHLLRSLSEIHLATWLGT